jgi:hypothetical protein
MNITIRLVLIILALGLRGFCVEEGRWWGAPVEKALEEAGANRAQLEKALLEAPRDQREGMAFLVEEMPASDRETLSSASLLENVALAYEARDAARWSVPADIFFNDVLPYASLNERREDWRRPLRIIAEPLVAGCKTPGVAAQALNRALFKKVSVRYSTERKKPDQSALESMESGVATCSGLSILLVNACRAVGVPARVAGTPMWMNLRGNHTWVEVWDNGWHYLGAAEPDDQGLDHGWFAGDASKARGDSTEHAIYASSFRRTGTAFPLVWDRGIDWVPALNVTARYTGAAEKFDRVRLLVRVLGNKRRIALPVSVRDPADPSFQLEGISRADSADLNNVLPFELLRGRRYEVRVRAGTKEIVREVLTGPDAEQTLSISMAE